MKTSFRSIGSMFAPTIPSWSTRTYPLNLPHIVSAERKPSQPRKSAYSEIGDGYAYFCSSSSSTILRPSMNFGVSSSPSSMKSAMRSPIFFIAVSDAVKKPFDPLLYAASMLSPSAMYFFARSISGDFGSLNPFTHGHSWSIATVPVATSGWPMTKPPTDLVSRTRSVIVGQKSGFFGSFIFTS